MRVIIVSVRRMVLDRIVFVKSSRWPSASPRGVTDLALFHEECIQNTRERPTIKLVELSINKHILDLIHKHHTTNGIPIAQARPMSVFDVSRSLLAKLSFNHPSVALTADVFFQFVMKPKYRGRLLRWCCLCRGLGPVWPRPWRAVFLMIRGKEVPPQNVPRVSQGEIL